MEGARSIDGVWLPTGEEVATWVEGLDLPAVFHEPPQVPRT